MRASASLTTSLRFFTSYPNGGMPPIHMPFFLEAAILSRIRLPVTSRSKGQAELLAHHACKEAADRVLLPTRRLHDGGDRCPLGLFKQGEDGLLLGPAAGRTQGNGPRLRRSVRAALGACKLGLCGSFAVRHFRILFGCDGTRRRHHRSPAVAPSPAGQDPGWGQPALISARHSDAPIAAEVHSFLR